MFPKISKDQGCLILKMQEYVKEYVILIVFPLQQCLYKRAAIYLKRMLPVWLRIVITSGMQP